MTVIDIKATALAQVVFTVSERQRQAAVRYGARTHHRHGSVTFVVRATDESPAGRRSLGRATARMGLRHRLRARVVVRRLMESDGRMEAARDKQWTSQGLWQQLEQFRRELETAGLRKSSSDTYVGRTAVFRRWLDGEYEPRGPVA